jgi:hypothetical protein
MRRLHAILTVVWTLMIIPGVLFWRNSVPFLVAVSIYANAAGHWGSYQGARAEDAAK